jgi:cytochrome d ubiquinol oxidase subunit II
MTLQIIWFALWGLLWALYFMLDGFTLGAGMLHPFIARTESQRQQVIRTFGPVWDGNEVWLITAGGATFAAFPTTYALMFSYLYTPLLLLLFGLIVRGVSFEFRGLHDTPAWKKGWDRAIPLSSLVIALLFGVAFGNIFQGLPMDGAGYHGSLLTLLNPYGLLTGLLFVLLFLEHGALYLTIKTEGELQQRALRTAKGLWPILLAVAVAFLAFTLPATALYDNFRAQPALWAVPLLAALELVAVRLLLGRGKSLQAFAASCAAIVLVVATGIIGLFPDLIPSSLDTAYSLSMTNSSSSPYTLGIMTVVVAIFVPIVIAYKIWIYYIFRGPVSDATEEGLGGNY